MKIGTTKELKNHEYRVGLTPDNVMAYVANGHTVYVEAGAGVGAGFSDDEYILCTAFAEKDTSCHIVRDFFIEVRKVYLLSFKRFDDSMPKLMPDFDGIRKMCDYLYSVIKDGTVLTAHALNGAVSTVTGSMNMINETKTFPADAVAQGFVMEALSFKELNAPLIGMMKREQN